MKLEIPNERILQHFVDRINEVGHFEGVLRGSDHRILWIHGPGGIGKSVLLSRMMDECHNRAIRWVHIEWTDGRKYDQLNLMREVRDRCERPELFQLFNDRVNHLTKPGYTIEVKLDLGDIENVEVLKDGTLESGGNTVHVGHTIQDLSIPVLNPDVKTDELARRMELTQAFFPCCEAVLREGPLVLFLDGMEYAEEEGSAIAWIREELLERIRNDGLKGLMVVLAGRTEVGVDPAFFHCMRSFRLQPFEVEDIEEYLRRRGVAGDLNQLAQFLLGGVGGHPDQVARMTNGYLLVKEMGG